jgi:hypothetical protein
VNRGDVADRVTHSEIQYVASSAPGNAFSGAVKLHCLAQARVGRSGDRTTGVVENARAVRILADMGSGGPWTSNAIKPV